MTAAEERATTRRKDRAGVEDRWHRKPRPDETDADWCTDAKHGKPGTLVCTSRHNSGRRWLARWVHNNNEETASFVRKADAEAKANEVRAEFHIGTYVDKQSSSATFGTVAEEWFAAVCPKWKQSTAAGYRSLLDMTILPRWRDVKLSDITHADVQEWVAWLTTNKDARQPRSKNADTNAKRKPLSARRAVQAHGRLSQVLDFAVRTKRLAANPAKGVELPRVVSKRDRALSHDEVAALVAAADEGFGPILLTLGYTGMRFGELAALRVADVNLTRRRIHVAKGVAQVTGAGLVEDTTKTSQERMVPILTTALADTLRDVMAGRAGDDYLFPGPDGGPMTNDYVAWRVDKACRATGLTDVTPKTFRHTAGSLALAAGASVTVVQRMLGHKDPMTTLRVYSHMLPDDFDNLAAAMDKATTVA